jgi:hypothetical protein
MNSELSASRTFWSLILHFLEMIVAMAVGMTALFPLWELATRAAASRNWLAGMETQALAMTTAMTLPMAAWARIRGSSPSLMTKMCLAMYAGPLVILLFHWGGMIADQEVMMFGHGLMVLFMFVALLSGRRQYARNRPWARSAAGLRENLGQPPERRPESGLASRG